MAAPVGIPFPSSLPVITHRQGPADGEAMGSADARGRGQLNRHHDGLHGALVPRARQHHVHLRQRAGALRLTAQPEPAVDLISLKSMSSLILLCNQLLFIRLRLLVTETHSLQIKHTARRCSGTFCDY